MFTREITESLVDPLLFLGPLCVSISLSLSLDIYIIYIYIHAYIYLLSLSSLLKLCLDRRPGERNRVKRELWRILKCLASDSCVNSGLKYFGAVFTTFNLAKIFEGWFGDKSTFTYFILFCCLYWFQILDFYILILNLIICYESFQSNYNYNSMCMRYIKIKKKFTLIYLILLYIIPYWSQFNLIKYLSIYILFSFIFLALLLL